MITMALVRRNQRELFVVQKFMLEKELHNMSIFRDRCVRIANGVSNIEGGKRRLADATMPRENRMLQGFCVRFKNGELIVGNRAARNFCEHVV